ncbi:MAG: hypothetical protein OQK04_11355, partial [Kangiellaceae bacterium]|nr:hypothetical protein [Kangiellaceae bacterium]
AFQNYHTSALPSGGNPRQMSVAKAFEEAGIQIQASGAANIIPTDEAQANHKWNNAELHDAMEKHFSLWQNQPGFKAWLFHANSHEYGPGLLGIMYDQKDKQRQGCASFYQTIGNNTAQDQRTQLYVNIHELGHCFNLYHSFHKKYMNPPIPNRPSALSWMNYPQYFPGGSSAFWSSFKFEFDEIELGHLRHGFRNNVIMGGNPFGDGAAAEKHEAFMDVVSDQSGIRLLVQSPHFVQLGTPIHLGISVTNISNEVKEVFDDLHPNNGLVQISLQKPNGEIINYHPPMSQLVLPQSVWLKPGESIEEVAYIGFDADHGQVFDAPGRYQLFATYYCPDGSAIRSTMSRVTVNTPRSVEDEVMAELLLGDEQGMLFFLDGSDSDYLKQGNDAFAEMKDRFADHPLTKYISVTEGIKASRTFVQIDTDKKIKVKDVDFNISKELLGNIVNKQPEQLGISPQAVRRAEMCLEEIDNLIDPENKDGRKKNKRKFRKTA